METANVLPDDAVVVRGGLMNYEATLRSVEAHFEARGTHGLSAYSLEGKSALEIAQAMGGDELPHNKMRVCTAGELRQAGFGVRPTPPPEGHVDIELPAALTPAIHASLDSVFSAPVPNPVAKPKGPGRG